jgi:2-C-methyl-D-erythritol 4-phosphate cytidylyltransferase
VKIEAIIPMAGLGTRLKSPGPKALIKVHGKPLFFYSLLALAKSQRIQSIILVVPAKYLWNVQALVKTLKLKKIKAIIEGGETRSASVAHGLQSTDEDTDFVLIHDGARPLIKTTQIDHAIRLALKEQAVVFGVPVKPTIKRVNKALTVIETIDRDELWEVQTPQIFRKDILVKAHQHKNSKTASDDAFLVEQMGKRVKIFPGSYENIKVTTPDDLALVKILLKKR